MLEVREPARPAALAGADPALRALVRLLLSSLAATCFVVVSLADEETRHAFRSEAMAPAPAAAPVDRVRRDSPRRSKHRDGVRQRPMWAGGGP